MGYGTRALEILTEYFQGNITDIREDENQEYQVNLIVHIIFIILYIEY